MKFPLRPTFLLRILTTSSSHQSSRETRPQDDITNEQGSRYTTCAGSKVTVDSDDMGGEVFSVRRVSDYLSSHIDLDDCIRTDMGCTQRDDGPNEVRNHHAPLTPRSTQSTDLFEREVYSREFQTSRL